MTSGRASQSATKRWFPPKPLAAKFKGRLEGVLVPTFITLGLVVIVPQRLLANDEVNIICVRLHRFQRIISYLTHSHYELYRY